MNLRRLLSSNLPELVAIWGISIVQPLLGVFGASAETFVASGIAPHTILPIVIAFCVIPPLGVWLIELALLRTPRVLEWFHRTILTLCIGLFFAQVFKVSFGITGLILVAIVAVSAALSLIAFVRVPFVSQWFRFLSVTPLLAIALFSLNSPSGRYALNSSGATHQRLQTDGSSVTFVMFDEFSLATMINADGQIDRARFPNFFRLSQISTWYRNYSTNAESTEYAVPVALSGTIPDFKKGPTVADYPHNLFTWLGGSYKMNVSEMVTSLCPPNICKRNTSGSSPEFLTRLKSLGQQAVDVVRQRVRPSGGIGFETVVKGVVADNQSTADALRGGFKTSFPTKDDIDGRIVAQTGRWRSWLAGYGTTDCPCLNFIHMLLPHHPWVFFPDGTPYTTDPSESDIARNEWETAVRHQRSALQAQYADSLVGELLDRLESTGLLGTTELVVAADHGISFKNSHDRRFLDGDYSNYPGILFPPLFIHKAGQTSGTISDANVESIDLMSLVANDIGSRWPWHTDGLLPSQRVGDKATKKTIYLLTKPILTVGKRPDKSVTFDAHEAQRAMFAVAHSQKSVSDYLAPLYVGTPFNFLRGTTVGRTSACTCSLKLDERIKALNPKVYLTGIVSGVVSEGDWIAFAVNGKISGLSPVYSRGNELRIISLLKSEDFTGNSPVLTAYRISTSGPTLRSMSLK